MITPPLKFWSIYGAFLLFCGISVALLNTRPEAYGKWFTQSLICFSTYCIIAEIRRKK